LDCHDRLGRDYGLRGDNRLYSLYHRLGKRLRHYCLHNRLSGHRLPHDRLDPGYRLGRDWLFDHRLNRLHDLGYWFVSYFFPYNPAAWL